MRFALARTFRVNAFLGRIRASPATLCDVGVFGRVRHFAASHVQFLFQVLDAAVESVNGLTMRTPPMVSPAFMSSLISKLQPAVCALDKMRAS